jgi:alkylation response protein AidB-like acyl-CoA dehydrogenase
MDFSLSDEQVQLQGSVRSYLRDHYAFDRRRAASRSAAGWDPDTWAAFADQLGILSLAVPVEPGDPVDMMVVMEELGAALVNEPYLETMIGAGLLHVAGGGQFAALLEGIVAGQARLALAWAEPGTRGSWEARATRAMLERSGWRITGRKSVVVGAPWATHLLVSAASPRGTSLFVAPADTPGLRQHAYPTIDGRRAADVDLDVLLPPDALVGVEGGELPLLEAAGDAAVAAMGAEAIGVMRRMLDDTIAFTKERHQFGQPISAFQVLQHRMVDMLMHIEMARSAVLLATLKLGATAAERARATSIAKVTVNEACRFVGQNAIQLHGGMGMTDEMPIAHYFKRTTVIEAEFGSNDAHLVRFAAADAATRSLS